MRKKFCCEASKHLYEDYYLNQSGNGLPVFSGSRGQRGHGLGSLLSGFFRSALPMIKRGLATFGKHALKTGLEIANDVVTGETFKESTKRRVPEGIKRFANLSHFSNQTGSGRRNKKRARKRRPTSTNKRKSARKNKRRVKRKKYDDIFN